MSNVPMSSRKRRIISLEMARAKSKAYPYAATVSTKVDPTKVQVSKYSHFWSGVIMSGYRTYMFKTWAARERFLLDHQGTRSDIWSMTA